ECRTAAHRAADTQHADPPRRPLPAGKHVFVEKPPAVSGGEADELVALAEEQDLVLLPGHLLLYHPAVAQLAHLIESGELGEILYIYGNRQNLGQIRKDENALWSLGVHDLSVILHLVSEEPAELWARGESFHHEGVEDVVFCYLRFPSGIVAHMHLSWLDPHKKREMTVVGRNKMAVFDDMELERKVTVYDKGTEQRAESYGEWRTRTGDIYIPKIPNDEPLRLECRHFLSLVAGDGDRMAAAREGAVVVRVLEQLQASLERAPPCPCALDARYELRSRSERRRLSGHGDRRRVPDRGQRRPRHPAGLPSALNRPPLLASH